MSGKLLLIFKASIMMSILTLSVVGTVYVLEIVSDSELQRAIGKLFALLGIYTGSALALTVLANTGNPKLPEQQPRF